MTRRRIFQFLVLALAIALLGFCGGSWFVGSRLAAPANRTVGPPPEDFPAESHTIASESGLSLATWYLPHPKSSATIVLLHPIRGDRRSMLGRARLFFDAGFTIVMADLQAHGESPGDYIAIGHLEKHDVRALVDFAQGINPTHRIGVVGRSLGGAATLLAVPVEIDALVLESVYPTISDAVYDRIEMRFGLLKHILAPALLCQLKPRLGITPADLRPIDCLDEISCPVLIASGDEDQHTPLDETMRMFEAASKPKRLAVFAGAGHVDLLEFDRPKYEAEVLGFLTACLQPIEVGGD